MEGDALVSINDIGPLVATLDIDEPEGMSVVGDVGPVWTVPHRSWRIRVPHCTARQMRRLQALIAAGLAPAADQPVEVRIHGEQLRIYGGLAWMEVDIHDLKELELCYSLDLRGVDRLCIIDT